jgi:hypothetical protein
VDVVGRSHLFSAQFFGDEAEGVVSCRMASRV